MGKQLVNFITCDCESKAPFFVIYKDGHEPTTLSFVLISITVRVNMLLNALNAINAKKKTASKLDEE
jgi:hypothetical protein